MWSTSRRRNEPWGVVLCLAWAGPSLTACSYDWTVPPSGAGGAAGTGGQGGTPTSTSSSGGGFGGTGGLAGGGGVAGNGGTLDAGPTSCAELPSCDECRSCVTDGLAGTTNDCWDYVICIAPCGGDTVCLLACWAQHPAGYQVREAIIEQCTSPCGGIPSCS